MIHVSNDIVEEDRQQDSTSEEQEDKLLRKYIRIRKVPQWFNLSGIVRTLSADEPAVRVAPNSDKRDAWKTALNKGVSNIQRMGCWNVVQRLKVEQVMHTKFVLKQ